jgi:hypothetical protein
MRDVCSLIWLALIGLFRSRASLQAEILTLRHQLNVLRRKSPQRPAFSSIDRLVFAGLYRLGRRLRRRLHPPPSGDEHSGSANRAAIAVAERLRCIMHLMS